jgi:hypothetical protein
LNGMERALRRKASAQQQRARAHARFPAASPD